MGRQIRLIGNLSGKPAYPELAKLLANERGFQCASIKKDHKNTR
jgi:hypothetical protein